MTTLENGTRWSTDVVCASPPGLRSRHGGIR